MAGNDAEIWSKVYKKNKDVVTRKIADELFLVPVKGKIADMQKIFTLNAVAECIWQGLDDKKSLTEIRKNILDEFSVERERLDSDITEFISELLGAELISE
jgi:hypothetical protein